MLQLQRFCFLLVVALLPLNSLSVVFPLNILGGGFANKASFYPAFAGMALAIYGEIRWGGIFADLRTFRNYLAVYLSVILLSTVNGLWNYPYYAAIKLPELGRLPGLLASVGFEPPLDAAAAIYIGLRVIKNNVLSTIYTFGTAYWIYCLFRRDAAAGIRILQRGIAIALVAIFSYSCVELAYLAGSGNAKTMLQTVNPWLYQVKSAHNWWPPLLWPNQVRSVFAEPSFFGIYIAFALPFLWQRLLSRRLADCLVLLGLTVLLFLTKARTAVLLFLGQFSLLAFSTLLLKRREYLFRLGLVGLVSAAAFAVSAFFINTFAGGQQPLGVAGTIKHYVNDNVESVADPAKRSNQSRYSVILADLRIGLDNPVLGVGIGLRDAYVPQHFSSASLKNIEIKNWVRLQKKEGILQSTIPKLCEYSARFAETGSIGLLVFLLPLLQLGRKMHLAYKLAEQQEKDNLLVFAISLLAVCAAGFSNTLDINYCYWVLLGLGYALFAKKAAADRLEKESGANDERTNCSGTLH